MVDIMNQFSWGLFHGLYISAQIIARTAEATRQVAGISEVSP